MPDAFLPFPDFPLTDPEIHVLPVIVILLPKAVKACERRLLSAAALQQLEQHQSGVIRYHIVIVFILIIIHIQVFLRFPLRNIRGQNGSYMAFRLDFPAENIHTLVVADKTGVHRIPVIQKIHRNHIRLFPFNKR